MYTEVLLSVWNNARSFVVKHLGVSLNERVRDTSCMH